jgi:hypothetical protein
MSEGMEATCHPLWRNLGEYISKWATKSLLTLAHTGTALHAPSDEGGSVHARRGWTGRPLFDVDNTLATALIDRLMHHGEALVIKGDSYRMRDKPSDPPSD